MTDKKPRWSSAKKAAAQSKSDKPKTGKKNTVSGAPAKKARWVDGKPARPAAADRGRPRWAREEEGNAPSGARQFEPRQGGPRQGGPGQGGPSQGGPRRSSPMRDDVPPRGSRGEPGDNRYRDDRPKRDFRDRDDRPQRSYGDRDDRPKRDFQGRDDRPQRSYGDRDDRPKRDFQGRDDRPPRSYRDRDRDDRPKRDFRDRDDRPQRSYGGSRDDRPKRDFQGRDDRPQRSYGDRDDRPKRDFRDRDDRPKRDFRDRDDRSKRDFQGRDDRPQRSYGGRDDRPKRDFRDRDDRPKRDFQGRDDRPQRSYGDRDDRPKRDSHGRDDRPQRAYQDRDDRPTRDFRDRDDRPKRDYEARDDRPKRDYQDRDDRPKRDYQDRDDRPNREFRDRPAARPLLHDRPTTRPAGRSAPRERYSEHVREATARITPPVERPAPPPGVGPTFADLGLPQNVLDALSRNGIHHPFPIQQATIPDALAGKDVLGRGRTGSGKTLGFGLPAIARLAGSRPQAGRPRAIVLVPTRELALQVADALEPIGRAAGVSSKVIAGGMPYPPQLAALERGVDLIVATPGRLQDLIDRGAAKLDAVEIVVLDEADHMADLGFLPEVTEILDLVPRGGQRLLFSATLDKGIDELAERYLVDPVTHSTDDATAAVTTMEHTVLLVEPSMKKTLTARISGRPGKTLIFVRTQLGADRVARQLRESGIMAGPIHGGLTQAVRTKVLDAFKEGRLDVLVATDVAARGIHVDDVTLVVQVDPPADHKTYVHRAGRTARAGLAGSVVTLALPHQRKAMERIIDEVALSIRPERVDMAGQDAVGPEPTGAPVPEEVWEAMVAPRPSARFKGRGRGPGRPRPDGGLRPRRRT